MFSFVCYFYYYCYSCYSCYCRYSCYSCCSCCSCCSCYSYHGLQTLFFSAISFFLPFTQSRPRQKLSDTNDSNLTTVWQWQHHWDDIENKYGQLRVTNCVYTSVYHTYIRISPSQVYNILREEVASAVGDNEPSRPASEMTTPLFALTPSLFL